MKKIFGNDSPNTLQHYGVAGMKWKNYVPGYGYGNEEDPTPTGPTPPVSAPKVYTSPVLKAKGGKGGSAKPKETDEAKAIKKANAKKLADAQKSADKAAAALANLQSQADQRREQAKAQIEYAIRFEKAKKDPKFDEAALTKKLQDYYAADLNATPESIKQEKVAAGANKARIALGLIADVNLSRI